ncbi:MAG TPA: hypothetical protein VFJ15_07520 [Oleiagrimonas sp.]|nr:hypothetical protein [Oleiagrimonas sp.]
MSVDITAPNSALSRSYRHAQRVTAQWLEQESTDARDIRFVLRSAWAALDAVERDRMVRWLAWLCVAASSRGDAQPASRLQQLDTSLGQAITRAMRSLPGTHRATDTPRTGRLRLSA